MCGGLEKLIGGGSDTPAPAVVRSSPVADQAAIDAEAAAKAAQAKTTRKRAVRAQSLLATGGGGDPTAVATGQPSAQAGKPTLGA